MSKNDRNTVTIGPARVKVEDSIYDAVDQGIVGTTNVTPTTPDTGFVPIGPIGDLITPPVLAPVTGYPILATAINFNDAISTYPFLSTGTSWAIMDLSSLGSFTNTLVVGAGSSDLAFVNLDNPSQRTTYAGKYKSGPLDFIIRDGVLTHGWSSFVGGVWLTDDVEITLNSITQTVTGTSINTALQTGRNDATHRYFYLGTGWGVGPVYARIAHTGSLSLEVVGSAPTGFNPGINPQFSVRCADGGILWIGAALSVSVEYAFAMEIATGICTSIYDISTAKSAGSSWFGLTTGEAAYLNYTSVGIDYTHDLYIIGLDGSVTTQASLITVLGGALSDFVPVHGTGTMLATTTNNPTTLYQISPAGYQIVGGTPNMISLPRISDAAPGALRFWGSDGDPSYTNVALYEVAL